MKLPFPFTKSTQFEQQQQQQWPWPSCASSTKTLSFRSAAANEEMGIITTESPPQFGGNTEDDSVIQGAINTERRRLFFTPGETNSILEEAKSKSKSKNNQNGFLGIKENKSVVMEEMESTNPYVDFRISMEEMVEANEKLKGSTGGLQELLSCYLTVNDKNNHVYIVGAFIDLLTSFHQEDEEQNHINIIDSSLSSNSPISALSSFTSNSSSCTSSTARSTTTPCSVEEEGGDEGTSSCSTSEKILVVVEEEEKGSPSCSLQV